MQKSPLLEVMRMPGVPLSRRHGSIVTSGEGSSTKTSAGTSAGTSCGASRVGSATASQLVQSAAASASNETRTSSLDASSGGAAVRSEKSGKQPPKRATTAKIGAARFMFRENRSAPASPETNRFAPLAPSHAGGNAGGPKVAPSKTKKSSPTYAQCTYTRAEAGPI